MEWEGSWIGPNFNSNNNLAKIYLNHKTDFKGPSWGFASCSTARFILRSSALPLMGLEPTQS